MVLLYQDPHGKTLSVIRSNTESKAMSAVPPQSSKTITELEKKVAFLEKTVQDGEATIAELKHQMGVMSKENPLPQVIFNTDLAPRLSCFKRAR